MSLQYTHVYTKEPRPPGPGNGASWFECEVIQQTDSPPRAVSVSGPYSGSRSTIACAEARLG